MHESDNKKPTFSETHPITQKLYFDPTLWNSSNLKLQRNTQGSTCQKSSIRKVSFLNTHTLWQIQSNNQTQYCVTPEQHGRKKKQFTDIQYEGVQT